MAHHFLLSVFQKVFDSGCASCHAVGYHWWKVKNTVTFVAPLLERSVVLCVDRWCGTPWRSMTHEFRTLQLAYP
jgi:hypothetical protein